MFARTLVLTFGSLALASLSLVSTPVVTTAEARQSRMRFEQMDRNNDGIISRDEWNGSARSFEVHDWNGDGQLSGPEVRVGARRTQTTEPDHAPGRNERYVNWTRAGFTALDHNRDNRIATNEWHFDTQTFRRVDANRDNSISLAEFLGESDPDDDREDNFDDLDYNNNGRVERAEWHGSLAEFRRLDANNDGILSRYEVVGSNESFNTYNEFAGLDYNRNGRLERGEWHWSNVSFTSRDTNRDGVLSQAEFDAGGGSPVIGAVTGTAGTQTVRVNSQVRWTDTGITVRAGDVITFSTQGQVQLSDNAQDMASSAGSLSGRTAADAPISGVLAGALIGRIGNYNAIAIGNQGTITAPVSGRLYLGVNDDHLPDNRGEFTVQVGTQRR